MRLNKISPAEGSKKTARRVGRGASAGQGKTAGRGQKGQHSRSGGYHKVGFEGGQMPLQRRLPKVGFQSRVGRFAAQVTLGELNGLTEETVDMLVLKKARLVSQRADRVKVIASGAIERAVTLKGLNVTKGAKAAIEKAGGTIES